MLSLLSSFDSGVVQALYAVRDPQWVLIAIGVSEFGEWYTVCGISIALALWLALRERFSLAQGLLLSVATSGIATFLLKSLIARPRPPVEFWAYHEVWYSFPSAHAALSVAGYGFIAYILWEASGHFLRRIIIVCTVLFVLVIGCTRLYLGLHYPTDILGGYLLGGACLWLGIWTERILHRGKMSSS